MAEPKGISLCSSGMIPPDETFRTFFLPQEALFEPTTTQISSEEGEQASSRVVEDEELEFSDSELNTTAGPLSPQQSVDYPSAPPPTPISPTPFDRENFANPYGYSAALDGVSDARSRRDVRPDKTDAVAKRMIAGALGVKAPKKTEEQKAYDKALKEKEMKRRNMEKEAIAKANEEAEKARAAVWDD